MYHVSMRLQERKLDANMLNEALESLEIVESYPDDKYLPSYLVRGECRDTVIHAHLAADVDDNENVRVVTMYLPNPDEWEPAFRRRKQI